MKWLGLDKLVESLTPFRDCDASEQPEFPYGLGDVEIGYVYEDGEVLDWWLVDDDVFNDMQRKCLWDDFFESIFDNISFEFKFKTGILTLKNASCELETEYGEFGTYFGSYPIFLWDEVTQREACYSCFAPDHEVVADGYCADCINAINETNQYHANDILGVN